MVVFRRKSWVIAMPMEAKAREVRSQARKVRSGAGFVRVRDEGEEKGKMDWE